LIKSKNFIDAIAFKSRVFVYVLSIYNLGQVKATVERAFWDVVRDQLKNGEDDMIIPMINEIREQILNFLAPNSGTKEKVKDQIDMELIEQQFTNGCLDYKVSFYNVLEKRCYYSKNL
jgi:hypothetical protein